MNKKYIIPLLLQYKKYPSLWDPGDENYKNQNNRERILKRILHDLKLAMPIGELRMRIKNLRTVYVREVNRIIETKKRGEEIHRPRLMWFDVADSFLRKVVTPRFATEETKSLYSNLEEKRDQTADQIEIDSEDDFDRSLANQKTRMEQVIVKEEDAGYNNYIEDTLEYSDEGENPLTTSKTQDIEKIWSKTMSVPTDKIVPNRLEDEFDTFGHLVAKQLRSLPLPMAIKSQNFIHNFLAQKRLKCLQASCSSSLE